MYDNDKSLHIYGVNYIVSFPYVCVGYANDNFIHLIFIGYVSVGWVKVYPSF